ncbi:3868_t:CDS:2 [Entrophospora sp. SA101]|nr:3868_t:CDS:2 [Entrophospora sp. SA101]
MYNFAVSGTAQIILLDFLYHLYPQGKCCSRPHQRNRNISTENSSLNDQQAVGNNNSISQPAGENVSERMVFNILWKSASNVVTIRCRINKLSIPSAVLNSGANFSIMSLNIAKKLGLDIDRNKTASLEGIATESDTIGR